MRIFDAISPETALDQERIFLQDDARPGRVDRPRAVAWETCYDKTMCGKSRKGATVLWEDEVHSTRQPEPRPKFSDERITTARHQGSRHALSAANRAGGMLVVLSLLLQPAFAVLIKQWSNCLPEPTDPSEPKRLQWVPLYVGAEFGNHNSSHNLRVTVWGNVTGSYDTNVALPAWDDPSWGDASFTDGKIVDNPFPTTAAHLTTLHDTIDVLTYEPYTNDFDFCHAALTNASCPLGPVFNTTDMYVSGLFPRSQSPRVLDVWVESGRRLGEVWLSCLCSR